MNRTEIKVADQVVTYWKQTILFLHLKPNKFSGRNAEICFFIFTIQDNVLQLKVLSRFYFLVFHLWYLVGLIPNPKTARLNKRHANRIGSVWVMGADVFVFHLMDNHEFKHDWAVMHICLRLFRPHLLKLIFNLESGFILYSVRFCSFLFVHRSFCSIIAPSLKRAIRLH